LKIFFGLDENRTQLVGIFHTYCKQEKIIWAIFATSPRRTKPGKRCPFIVFDKPKKKTGMQEAQGLQSFAGLSNCTQLEHSMEKQFQGTGLNRI